jgi:hypothetical protein
MRRTRLVAALLFTLPGCSAVGAWMYQDPSYSLQAVSLRPAAEQGVVKDSVELMFIGCNLNDYDITETSFLTRLAINGKTAGEGDHGQTVFLDTRGAKQFSVVVPLATEALPEDRGTRPFEVLATSQVKTPIGDRAIAVKLAGQVQRQGDQLNWLMKPQVCKPGSSILPASFDTRPIPPEAPRERPNGIDGPGMNQRPN